MDNRKLSNTAEQWRSDGVTPGGADTEASHDLTEQGEPRAPAGSDLVNAVDELNHFCRKLNCVHSVDLEHVLGMTLTSRCALAVNFQTGVVAFPAGSVLVLLDGIKYKQVSTLQSPGKTITSAHFSPDGRYVVTGEAGLRPAVRVWEVHDMREVATLRGHSFGITSVTFTPRMREIISVGEPRDMTINVWAWPGKYMRAQNKFADEIFAMAVSEDSSFFITAGNRHVKFYYLERQLFSHASTLKKCPIPLVSHSGILDTLMENSFCDVICGTGISRNYIYVVSMSGVLIQINERRLLERWVDVNMSSASCLAGSDDTVLVGGAQGTVRMFRSLDLEILATLPRPHSLGLDIAQVVNDISDQLDAIVDPSGTGEGQAAYPNTHSLVYDPQRHTVTAIYDNHSLYVWQTSKLLNSFHKRHSRMYHSRCVWAMTSYPHVQPLGGDGCLMGALPPGALLSVSSDGTLRAWDVCSRIGEESVLKRNCVSEDCLKIVYVGADKQLSRGRPRSHNSCDASGSPGDRHNKHVFTVLAVCPEGQHIAIGNRSGRISIYDANTMSIKVTMAAHDSDVTALCYSQTHSCKILASGSRDRMIHVTDATRNYKLLTTLDDHSSTLTAIHFTVVGASLMMVSSSLDMSVLVRAFVDKEDAYAFKPVRAIVEKKAVMDLTIHPTSGLMALACADRLVRIYTVLSSTDNSSSYSFRGCPSGGGQLLKIQTDPSGHFLLTACSNKTINVLQFRTGRMLLTFHGHAETISCVLFSHNMRHVVSSACDGCVFLWKLPESMTYFVKCAMAERGRLPRGMVQTEAWTKTGGGGEVEAQVHLRELPDLSGEEERMTGELDHSSPRVMAVAGDAFFMGMDSEVNARANYLESSSNDNEPAYDDDVTPASGSRVEVQPERWFEHVTSGDELPASQSNKQFDTTPGLTVTAAMSGTESPNLWSRRRENFKLEYESIKKMLAVMKLVTDAMEKDLEQADHVLHSRRASPTKQVSTWDFRCKGDGQNTPEYGQNTPEYGPLHEVVNSQQSTSTSPATFASYTLVNGQSSVNDYSPLASHVSSRSYASDTGLALLEGDYSPRAAQFPLTNEPLDISQASHTNQTLLTGHATFADHASLTSLGSLAAGELGEVPWSTDGLPWSTDGLHHAGVDVRRYSNDRVNVEIFTQKTSKDLNYSNDTRAGDTKTLPTTRYRGVSHHLDCGMETLNQTNVTKDLAGSLNKITFKLSSAQGQCECVGSVVFDDSAATSTPLAANDNNPRRLRYRPKIPHNEPKLPSLAGVSQVHDQTTAKMSGSCDVTTHSTRKSSNVRAGGCGRPPRTHSAPPGPPRPPPGRHRGTPPATSYANIHASRPTVTSLNSRATRMSMQQMSRLRSLGRLP